MCANLNDMQMSIVHKLHKPASAGQQKLSEAASMSKLVSKYKLSNLQQHECCFFLFLKGLADMLGFAPLCYQSARYRHMQPSQVGYNC